MATRKSIEISLFAKDAPVTKALDDLTARTEALRGLARKIDFGALDDRFKIKAKEVTASLDRIDKRVASPKITLAGAERVDSQLDRVLIKLREIGASHETATATVKTKSKGSVLSRLKSAGPLGSIGSILSLGSGSIGGTSGGIASIAGIAAIAQGLTAATIAAGGLATALAPIAGGVMGKISKQWSTFSKMISGTKAGKTAINSASEAFHALLGAITPIVVRFLPLLTRLFNDIGKSVQSGGLEKALTWIAVHGPSAFNSVAHGVRIAGKAIHFLQPAIHMVTSTFSAFFKLLDAGFDIVGLAIDLLTGNWKAAGHEFGAVIHNIVSAFGSLLSAVGVKLGTLVAWFKKLPGRIVGALGDVGSFLYNAGKNIVQGLINGIESMLGSVGSAMGGIASKIRGFLPFSPAREGPLSGSGSPTIAGAKIATMLATGIMSGHGVVANAASGLARNVASSYGASARYAVGGGNGGKTVVEVQLKGGDSFERQLFKMMAHQIRVRGGDPAILTTKPRSLRFATL